MFLMSTFWKNTQKTSSLERKLKLFDELSKTQKTREEKLDDLILLLEASDLNSKELEIYENKVSKFIYNRKKNNFRPFFDISSTDNQSRSELIDRFEVLLNESEFDSDDALRILKDTKVKSIVKFVIGFLFMFLGLSMIILPSPPYFELYTVFYFDTLEIFNINTAALGLKGHGITIMDIISVIIIFFGIYIMISARQKHSYSI